MWVSYAVSGLGRVRVGRIERVGLVIPQDLSVWCGLTLSSSSSCHQTFRFHCSVHLYPISLNFRRLSNVHGCVKREHRTYAPYFLHPVRTHMLCLH